LSDLLDCLEQSIADRLTATPYFSDLTILSDPQKNIVNEITLKVSKIRTVIVPFVAAANDEDPDLVEQVFYEDIKITIGVFQNPLIMLGALKTPRAICSQIVQTLKGWIPDNMSACISPVRPTLERVVDAKLNIWSTNFTAKGGFINTMSQVAAVTKNTSGGNTTFACATPNAAIFYTINGDNPAPVTNVGQGLLATGPIAFTTGTRVRARAWLAGYNSSPELDFIAP